MADLYAGRNVPLSKAFSSCGWETIAVDWLWDASHDLSDPRRQASLHDQLQSVCFIAAALNCSTKSRAREIPRDFGDGAQKERMSKDNAAAQFVLEEIDLVVDRGGASADLLAGLVFDRLSCAEQHPALTELKQRWERVTAHLRSWQTPAIRAATSQRDAGFTALMILLANWGDASGKQRVIDDAYIGLQSERSSDANKLTLCSALRPAQHLQYASAYGYSDA
eukprot:s1353_g16.t1